MENVMFEDVALDLIDNEFPIEQEFDGMANDGSSEPMADLDFSSEQP